MKLSPVLGATLLAAVIAGPAAAPTDPLELLRTVGRFSASDLSALDRGLPVAKVLDTDRREVAIIGATRVHAPLDRVLAHYRDVSRLGRSAVVDQVGTFSQPPRPEDLRDLVFEDYDLETIRDCAPGACGVRLSAADMARFAREVNWGSADWRGSAGAAWRRILAEYAAGYMAQGGRALSEYRNRDVPLKVADEIGVLFGQSEFFTSAAPGFMQHVRDFPAARLPGAEDILYWTRDSFGVRPVFSITHLLIYRAPPAPAASRPIAMVAAKQIYATHYFDAGLGLTAVYAHPSGGLLLVAINRARTRSLTSVMRTFVRSTVQNRSRDAMEKILRTTKDTLEQHR